MVVGRSFGLLVLVILLAFALPALFNALETIMIPLILILFVVSIGSLLYRRRRRW